MSQKIAIFATQFFVAHVGFLGYTANEDGVPGYEDGFGINLDGNDILCGLYFNF